MRILAWHGYLLRGSGSNIYNANTARAWKAAGHQVLVMCQEHDVADLDFVDSAVDMKSPDPLGGLERELGASGSGGCCFVIRPDIGEILPVYVYDSYEGFIAKRFVDLTDAELGRYVDSNVDALMEVIARLRPDAILVGHEVMGPYIAGIACNKTGTRFLAKLHGSALEYAVKVQDRYLGYATDGLGAAAAVVGGSRYMIDEASRVIPGWRNKAAVVNPGCDVDLFRPRSHRHETRIVGFVGKLIASKGVHDLLGALGLTTIPGMSVRIVGYGGFEGGLRSLAQALRDGDLETARAIASRGENGSLPALQEILDNVSEGYMKRSAEVPVEFLGRLEHGPLSQLMPDLDVLAVPSVVAEAFGMVAAEAAACGVLPLVPSHSGIGEVGAALEEALGRPGLLTYPADDPIRGLAESIQRILSLDAAEREDLGREAAEFARSRWAWERVCGELLSLATGAEAPQQRLA